MSVWFTSDMHFGHRLVAGHRGFGEDFPAHDMALCDNWRRVVRGDDDVWVLGDLAVSSPARALEIISELPGRKHLISGNHDKCHPMHRDSHKHLAKYLDVFESVQPFARRRIDGHEVLLSHFPYHKDRHEVRHTQYRLRDEGRWLLHGHTHGPERMEVTDHPDPIYGVRRTKEIHVGVDAWDLTPVSLDDIAELLREGEGHE